MSVPTWEPVKRTILRKYKPCVRPPEEDFLRRLDPLDRRLLKRRLVQTAECVFHPSFRRPDAEQRFGGPFPTGDAEPNAAPPDDANDDSNVDLVLLPNGRVLSASEESEIFLRFNYCRYRVMCILRRWRGRRIEPDAARELLQWVHRERTLRAEIVRLNLPLVLAMARRTRITGVDFADLISEGNLALLRSVDKFDCRRGFKFSTYACRAILKSFSRVATRTARYRGHFPVEFDPTLEKSDFVDQKRRRLEDDCVCEIQWILGDNLANLSPTEQTVIRARFALDGEGRSPDQPTRGKTLEQVGEMLGVTKERVRQIQNKALAKLRAALENSVLAP